MCSAKCRPGASNNDGNHSDNGNGFTHRNVNDDVRGITDGNVNRITERIRAVRAGFGDQL